MCVCAHDILRARLSRLPQRTQSTSAYGSPVDSLLTRFQWDEAKYPVRRPLGETKENIVDTVLRLDEDFKMRMGEYMITKNKYSAMQRRQQGGLAVRDMEAILLGAGGHGGVEAALAGVIDTENLVSVFVVVPSHLKQDWYKKYERLASDVVPRSATLVAKDETNEMYSVVMFRRVADSFRTAAQNEGFIVRKFDKKEFVASVTAGSSGDGDGRGAGSGRGGDSRSSAEMAMREQERKLYEWCSASYSECFSAWMHIYAIRVYVESILRYGLPPNFLTVVMKPNTSGGNRKNEARVRTILNESCIMLENSSKYWKSDGDDAKSALSGASDGEHQYVSFSIVA